MLTQLWYTECPECCTAGPKGKQTGKKGSNSQVAKMWDKAPPKSQKQAAKSAPQATKKAKVVAKETPKVHICLPSYACFLQAFKSIRVRSITLVLRLLSIAEWVFCIASTISHLPSNMFLICTISIVSNETPARLNSFSHERTVKFSFFFFNLVQTSA